MTQPTTMLYGPDGRPIHYPSNMEIARRVSMGAALRPRRQPITRKNLEQTRIRVTFACLLAAVEKGQRKLPVRHLWFPEDNANKYSLRDGNPPADVDRPKHLKGRRLVIDLGVIPREVWVAVKKQRQQAKRGTAEPTRMVEVMDNPLIIEHVKRIETKDLLPKA